MKRLIAFLLASVLILPLLSVSAAADHDDHDHHDRAYPYYGPIHYGGYYYESYSHSWSGWDWNRVYYRYHAPYYTQHVIAPHVFGPPSPYDWYW